MILQDLNLQELKNAFCQECSTVKDKNDLDNVYKNLLSKKK